MDLWTDVNISGVRYQVGRFTARDGSWILAQLLTKMLPSIIESALNDAGIPTNLATNRSALSEEEFASIQGHCLAVCRRYDNGVPMPIFVRPSTWAIKELEYNLPTVIGLTVQALKFNIAGFFQGGGLTQLMSLLPPKDQEDQEDQPSSASPTSIPTSSAPS
jgi:hypothetical protein